MSTSSVTFAVLRRHKTADLIALLDTDVETAATWLKAAARYGFVEAQLAYAQCLLDGRGVARDRPAAFRWFSTAARSHLPEAANMLGRCHENGWGTPADAAAAAPLYLKAAQSGLDWGQYNYANLQARGAGVMKDLPSALSWYRRAAAQGHAKSINLVGRFLEEGWAVPRDVNAAAECYRRAAERGDFRGQYNHGSVLSRAGRLEEATAWFRRAAAGGTPGFRRSMARSLVDASDPGCRVIAREILAELCQSGEPQDQLAYARVLMSDGNTHAALHWLRKAAAAGCEQADELMKQHRSQRVVSRLEKPLRSLFRRFSLPCSPRLVTSPESDGASRHPTPE